MPITNFDELYTALNESFSGQIAVLRTELIVKIESEIESVRNDLKSEIESVRNDLKSDMESVRNDLKSDMESVRNDLKADSAKLGAQMAAMEWRLLDRIRIEYDVDSVKQKRLDALEKRVTALEQKIA